MDIITGELAGAIASFFAILIYLPQLIKTVRTRRTRDISFLFLIFIVLCNIAWAFNGVLTNSPSRLFSAIVIILMTIPMMIIKIKNLEQDKISEESIL